MGELLKAGRLGNRLRRLVRPTTCARSTTCSPNPPPTILDGWFEGDLLKALHGFDAIVGNYASPYTPGTAYVLLHHAFGEVNGKKRIWGHAIGGMGAITQAMARAAAEPWRRDRNRSDACARSLIEKGRAAGVVLGGRARRSAAARWPPTSIRKLLYTAMVPDGALDPAFLDRMRRWRCGSGTFRMNVALSQLPSFTALPGSEPADHHTAGIILAPSLDYMDRAYGDARQHGWSREPIIEMLIPSTLDDTLAPRGAHVASLFCQHVAPELPDGRSWSDHRDEVADLMIDTVERYAPGFKASVVGRQALSPLDLEEIFGLTGGDIFHGALVARSVVLGAPRARLCRLSRTAEGTLPLRRRARIRAAASPARPGTTPRAPSWRTCGGAFRPGGRLKVGVISA